MSNPGDADATPITSLGQLADYIAEGCKPATSFRVGTEHEKFGFRLADLAPPHYEPGGIGALLEGIAASHGMPIEDEGRIIGVKQGKSSISLEPAGQLELSGAPLATLHETRTELETHLAEVKRVAAPLGLDFAPLGFHPTMRRDDMPWMPKGRYAVMRRYMPLVGSMGLDMMTRTCTVQANLDYASEEDMRRKLRVALALQPIATALFANSPFTEGRPNGFLSYRAHVWTDTDNQRSGIPAVMFDEGFGFERYVAWLIDEVPMYFVHRNGRYTDVAGQSFRRFMEGRVPELAGEAATVGDFADHMTTAFTDVRLKRFLEMRGADAGRPAMMVAQSAFWVGLLYDQAALAAALSLVRSQSWADTIALRNTVPKRGLETPYRGGGALRRIAGEALDIARDGLRARDRHDGSGRDEAALLDPLHEIIDGAPTQAEWWLERYRGAWNGDVTRIFREASN